MNSNAIIIREPERVEVGELPLNPLNDADVLVEVAHSGVSSGTERLFWSGRMPDFPGMGYPLVPGYESVGRVVDAGAAQRGRIGDFVFVPGANCFAGARGLFGATASHLVVPGARAMRIDEDLGERAALLALAATAVHAVAAHAAPPELIVGHGVLGRLLARLACLAGGAPTVWERNPGRQDGAEGYTVCAPEADTRQDYRSICDASGDPGVLDTLIRRLAPGGEIVLAGFYPGKMSFDFAPAFMREARLRVVAQWQPDDLVTATRLVETGALGLHGLISHRAEAAAAASAYETAFTAPDCLKLILDWRRP